MFLGIGALGVTDSASSRRLLSLTICRGGALSCAQLTRYFFKEDRCGAKSFRDCGRLILYF